MRRRRRTVEVSPGMTGIVSHAPGGRCVVTQDLELTSRPGEAGEADASARSTARERIEKRRGLQGGMVAYVVINAFLIGIWALTGMGYFWPAWILAGWGVGMLLGLWDYWRGPVTEADIDEELRRRHR
jgi:hypothetical protein